MKIDSQPAVPVSWGELLDKVTILEIKAQKLSNEAARKNVEHELTLLTPYFKQAIRSAAALDSKIAELRQINQSLWDIEDEIRDKERAQDFGAEFIKLARSVYHTNDMRAAVKREINQLLSSGIFEEKSYKAY